MHPLLRSALVILILLAGWAAPPPLAQSASLDRVADRVFGQTDFMTSISNADGLSAASLSDPIGVAQDKQGNLYVADSINNRVLEYDAPLGTGAAAHRVFGQADFIHTSPNHDGIRADSLNRPGFLALDDLGNLYVSDSSNNRVLEYDSPLTSDSVADRVFGQAGFTTGDGNQGGLSASSLLNPAGLALDAAGNLFVADSSNNRVLEYNAPLTTNRVADHVIGQPDLTHNDVNAGTLNASGLFQPGAVALDAAGNLYVSDVDNYRVLEYDTPLTSNHVADRVFGQANSFTTNNANKGGLSADSLNLAYGLALDQKGNLYVADAGNNRLLEFDTPLTSGTTADLVFGQPNFTSSDANNGGISASRLHQALGVSLDAADNLYAADSGNNRVLEYDAPIARSAPSLAALSPTRVAAGSPSFTLTVNGAHFYGNSVVRWNGVDQRTSFVSPAQLTASISAAELAGAGPFAVSVFTPAPGGGLTSLMDLVLYARAGHDTLADVEQGQPNFVSAVTNNGLLTEASTLGGPVGITVDRHTGRLFVADLTNNRVLSWPSAAAQVNGQPADLVLGQPNFHTTSANTGGRSARSLSGPFGLAVDAAGNLYVADHGNNRVLEYDAPLSSGMAANRVFGQGGNFGSGADNNGGLSSISLSQPWALAIDPASGTLFVADPGNNRVLAFLNPLASDLAADNVFGQPNFSSNSVNLGAGVNALGLWGPLGVALDSAGNLYVSDADNNRVVEYDAPLSNRVADRAFGQPNLTSGLSNNNGLNANSLYLPQGIALDGWGSLYVADRLNNRVLQYDQPLANRTADRVFGQPSFITNTANIGGVNAAGLSNPIAVALDAGGNLYVVDNANRRVLEYDWALAKLALPLIQR